MHAHCKNAKYVPSSPPCSALAFALLLWFFLSPVLTVGFQGGEVRPCQSSLQKLRRIRADADEASRVEDRGDPGSAAHEGRVHGGTGRDARPGQETYSGPLLDAVFKMLAMMATGKRVQVLPRSPAASTQGS